MGWAKPRGWILIFIGLVCSAHVEAEIHRGEVVQVPKGAESPCGGFVTGLCRDLAGNVWASTEGAGVFRLSPDEVWTRFTAANTGGEPKLFPSEGKATKENPESLQDDFGYAIACDALGRIWVGTRSHGVAVFNGESWQTFDTTEGPFGERVFDIAVSPTGEVWIATSLGLTRYREPAENDTTLAWKTWTRADGLPSDQIRAIAFATDGMMVLGMPCDGVLIGNPTEDPEKWRHVRSRLTEDLFTRPIGKGLPSDLVNDVLVTRDGTIYAGTVLGLARSTDKGVNWDYVRGRDYADKVRRRRALPPRGWREAPRDVLDRLLPEDFVTTLAEDEKGRLYVGFCQNGLTIVGPKPNDIKRYHKGKEFAQDWVTAVLPGADGTWVGGYGHGLSSIDRGESKAASPKESANYPLHPSPALPPTVAELEELAARIKSLEAPQPTVWAAVADEDWRTMGDWFGRLGNDFALLCAAGSPLDHETGSSPAVHHVRGIVGPHGSENEALRHWIHWMKSDERRVLHNPLIGYRREAEWDDHGEAYPMTHDGPDMWVEVTIPAEVQRVSLYFINPNGHEGPNRFRDYVLEVRAWTSGDVQQVQRSPVLARTRVHDFWGGVYKSFLLKGPNKYWIKIDRNYSFNTIVSGVFLDRVIGPPHVFDGKPLPNMGFLWLPPAMPKYWEEEEASDAVLKVVKLKELQEGIQRSAKTATWYRTFHMMSLRSLLGDKTTPKNVIGNWSWHLRLWTAGDRALFDQKMRTAWKIMCQLNPGLEKAKL